MAVKLYLLHLLLWLCPIFLREKKGLCFNIGVAIFFLLFSFFFGLITMLPLLGNYVLEKKKKKKGEGTLYLLGHSWFNAHVFLLHLLY